MEFSTRIIYRNPVYGIESCSTRLKAAFKILLFGICFFNMQPATVRGQQLELFASENSGIQIDGPLVSNGPAIFRSNTGRNTNSSTHTPTTTLTLSFSDQRFTSSTYPGMTFGSQTTESASTLGTMRAFAAMNGTGSGSPTDNYFTSGTNATPGTNFDVDYNYGFHMFLDSYYQRGQNRSGRFYYGKLTFTFNRPVVNPVLHFTGMGGAYGEVNGPFMGFYTEFELDNTNLSISRLSGNSNFSVVNNGIFNTATAKPSSLSGYTTTAANAGAGSVSVNSGGVPVTSITFSVFLKGNGSQSNTDWSSASRRAGDGTMISASLDIADISLSGTVFNDANGMTDNAVNGIPYSGPLYVTLVNSASGLVVANQLINPANGSYNFTGSDGVTQNTDFVLYLNTSALSTGTYVGSTPAATLPHGWESTGEYRGTGPVSDGSHDSRISVNVTTASVTNINFGIQRPPNADAKAFSVPESAFSGGTPAGGYPVVAGFQFIEMSSNELTGYSAGGSLSGTDPEDCSAISSCNTGTGTTFVVNAINANTRLYYNSGAGPVLIDVSTGPVSIPNFDASQMVIYGQNGSGTSGNEIGFNYSITDKAGRTSSSVPYTITTNTSLPVRLLHFNAYRENEGVLLKWATTSENGSDYFDVQHSLNAVSWNALHKIKAQGESAVTANYYHSHVSPSAGVNYYRLKMVDADGSYTYSGVVSLRVEKTTDHSIVFPNPTSGLIRLDRTQPGTIEKVELINLYGRVVFQDTKISGGSINVKGVVSKGIYLLKLSHADGTQSTHRIVISD